MNREDKIKLAIEKGITCNPETGEIFSKYRKVNGSKHKKGYLTLSIRSNGIRYKILIHQFIYYWVYKKVVDYIDHINRDKSDNRISNLRSVSNKENMWNKDVKGYSWCKDRKKYRAQININGINKNLGRFNTKGEAKQAYLEAKQKYHQI